MKIRFGLYAQVFLDHNITNDTKPRTEGAIALYATGNTQGAWIFMSLQSGRKFQGRSWKVLPTPQSVIDRVHEIAITQGQKKMAGKNFIFEWRPNTPFTSDDHEDNFDNITEDAPVAPAPVPVPIPNVSPSADPTVEDSSHLYDPQLPDPMNDDVAPDFEPNSFERDSLDASQMSPTNTINNSTPNADLPVSIDRRAFHHGFCQRY